MRSVSTTRSPIGMTVRAGARITREIRMIDDFGNVMAGLVAGHSRLQGDGWPSVDHNRRMNVAKLLQALEELIFEVACLAVLLPKTFFGLAFSPGKAHAYVIDELQKKPEDRFDRYTSPLILWSVTGILPHFIILSIYAANPTISKLLAANTDDLLLKMLT